MVYLSQVIRIGVRVLFTFPLLVAGWLIALALLLDGKPIDEQITRYLTAQQQALSAEAGYMYKSVNLVGSYAPPQAGALVVTEKLAIDQSAKIFAATLTDIYFLLVLIGSLIELVFITSWLAKPNKNSLNGQISYVNTLGTASAKV